VTKKKKHTSETLHDFHMASSTSAGPNPVPNARDRRAEPHSGSYPCWEVRGWQTSGGRRTMGGARNKVSFFFSAAPAPPLQTTDIYGAAHGKCLSQHPHKYKIINLQGCGREIVREWDSNNTARHAACTIQTTPSTPGAPCTHPMSTACLWGS